jgi:hypothetical protein
VQFCEFAPGSPFAEVDGKVIMKRPRATTTPAEILIVKEGRGVLRQLARWLAEGGYLVETKEPPLLEGVAAGGGRRAARVITRSGRAPHGAAAANKNMHAAALGRLGGRKGGFARAARLTARRRSEIARNAARARWRMRSKVS